MDASARLAAFPRKSLGLFPTPLQELPRLSKALGGPTIFVKRDDQTGLALGGNKTRKLEYLLGAALAEGADCVLTAGAAQSNHCRQTAAAAALAGLDCHLVLGGTEPPRAEGNLLLDRLLGAEIHWGGPKRKGEDLPALAAELRARGRRPYVIPYGGSSPLGALGFVEAARELAGQLAARDLAPAAIVYASSSGGTQAGLEVGARLFGLGARLEAIGIDKEPVEGQPFVERVRALVLETAGLFDLALDPAEIGIREEFLGAGYGIVDEAVREAVLLAARSEGLLLDPVYTGKAFAGLIGLIRSGELGPEAPVLFWHTGGAPALFPYGQELLG